jgi:pimeloyl-ACP methyl ester carboxylesterase
MSVSFPDRYTHQLLPVIDAMRAASELREILPTVSTFVLLPGAWHGAWCWDRLIPELTGRGHDALAVDLPSDRDAGLEEHADVVENALPHDREDVVLVGHSISALILPVVAARNSLRHIVALCGLLTGPGESMSQRAARDADVFASTWWELSAHLITWGDGSSAWPEAAAIDAFYHDCSEDVARSAAARLGRQFWRLRKDRCPVPEYPPTPATYILCRDDRVINPAWSRRAAAEILGVPPVEMDGGHSPFLSRPAELADRLAALG